MTMRQSDFTLTGNSGFPCFPLDDWPWSRDFTMARGCA